MVQFQGMIAEYERAQILERSRRGKRHRAKAGEVSVLGGAFVALTLPIYSIDRAQPGFSSATPRSGCETPRCP